MRLIDADAFKEWLMKNSINERELEESRQIGMWIDSFPSAESRKKGKWELHTDERFDIDYYKCSVCGYEPYRKMDISNFCPNCGCDMRGEQDEIHN